MNAINFAEWSGHRCRWKILHCGLCIRPVRVQSRLANLQNHLKSIYVEAVVPDVSAGSFTIYLSKAVPAGDKAIIGWFVVN